MNGGVYFELGGEWRATSEAQTCRGSEDVCKGIILLTFCLRLGEGRGGYLRFLLMTQHKVLFINTCEASQETGRRGQIQMFQDL